MDLHTIRSPCRRDAINLRLRLIHSNSWFEATDNLQHEFAAVRFVVAAVIGDPDVNTGLRADASGHEQGEAWPQNPDDLRAASSGTRQFATDDVRISAITPLEVVVAKDGNGALRWRKRGRGWAVWYAICLGEVTAEYDLSTEHVEEVSRDQTLADALGSAILARDNGTEDHDRRQIVECSPSSIAQIEKVRVRNGSVR